MSDEINNPSHYQLFPDQQAIDVIEAALTPEEYRGYLKGNALKYRLRAGEKGDPLKCLGKANWYQTRLRSAVCCVPEIDPDTRTITEWPADDARMDAIGQNGNDGLHYAHCHECLSTRCVCVTA